MRRAVWVAPVLAMVALVFAGTWLRSHVERSISAQVEAELKALLEADVTALTLWLRLQEENATAAAVDPEIQQAILDLVAFAAEQERTPRALMDAPSRAQLDSAIKTFLAAHGYDGFVVVNRDGHILAAEHENLLGLLSLLGHEQFAERVFSGKPSVSRPFTSRVMLPDEQGELAVGVPTMFAGAPVRDAEGDVVAFIGLRIQPSEEFTHILNVGRFGETGETFAFDKQGQLLSASRFETQLKEIGLMPDQPNARSVLAVSLRDPGVDMVAGQRPELPRSEQPLTVMAQDAIAGNEGVNAGGYRDYRGVMVVGAWTWLPEYEFGVATEVDQWEVYQPVAMVRVVFWSLFGLLAAAALGILLFTFLAGRLQRRVREAMLAAGKLGQYALEEKIGEGGMGAVYRAKHALLRRPTAVKLLEPSKTTEISIARFEREVQHTSLLNHPNTITIYDYGRTDEGVFYYAMEYLDGFSLQSIVERFGPQSDGRVVQILLQVCGSLLEAHTQGLIHRDIKPANIMLTRRGGVNDFVKLLDFGLVKATDNRMQTQLTAADSITGTPLYLPPECIQDPDSADARSDLYSLGGVGYYLLTGRPPFEAGTVLEIIRRQVEDRPAPPSELAAIPMADDLERILLRCLEKSPTDRFANTAQLADALAGCTPQHPWTAADSARWWSQHGPASSVGSTSDAPTEEIQMGATVGYSTVQR